MMQAMLMMQIMLMMMTAEMLRCRQCYVKHNDVCPLWMPSQPRGLSPALFQHLVRSASTQAKSKTTGRYVAVGSTAIPRFLLVTWDQQLRVVV